MANHVQNEPIVLPRLTYAGGITGAKGNGGTSGKRKVEANTPSPSDSDTLFRQLLQAVNNLKADFGSLRKALLNTDGSKLVESIKKLQKERGALKNQYKTKSVLQALQ